MNYDEIDLEDHKDVTRLLCRATTRGVDIISILPPMFEMTVSDHSTGKRASIKLATAGVEVIPAWTGSVWIAEKYECNDKDKVLGLNPEVAFAHETLRTYFATVLALMRGEDQRKAEEQRAAEEKRNCEHQKALAIYRAMF